MNEKLEDERNYCVYVHVNKINQKKYVGITCKKPEERWKKDGYGYKKQSFYNAILKYGWDNFEHIILEDGLTCSEANEKEKEYIEKFDSYSNGYNNSYGGDGTNGFLWSEERKKKMVETRINNGSFKGSNNPAYGKSPKERLNPEMYELWRNKLQNRDSYLGKKVICINTGEIFDRIGKAADKYNISARNLSDDIYRHCGVKIELEQYHLYYIFDYYDESKEYKLIDYCYKYNDKSVICLETKEVFWCSNDAGHIMNIPGSSIARVCSHKRKSIRDLHFMYVKEYIENGIAEENLYNQKKKIICVTTNEIFDSITEASKKYNLEISGICFCCNDKIKYNGKIDNIPLVWQYYDEYLVNPKDSEQLLLNNTVHCISLDLYFCSFKIASKYTKVCEYSIRQCCRGKYNYAGIDKNGNKLLWEYYTHTLGDNINLITECE